MPLVDAASGEKQFHRDGARLRRIRDRYPRRLSSLRRKKWTRPLVRVLLLVHIPARNSALQLKRKAPVRAMLYREVASAATTIGITPVPFSHYLWGLPGRKCGRNAWTISRCAAWASKRALTPKSLGMARHLYPWQGYGRKCPVSRNTENVGNRIWTIIFVFLPLHT